MLPQLRVGEKAHDFLFVTPWDSEKNFFAVTAGKRSLLFFLRYYGCTTCQLEIHNLILDYPAFRDAGVDVYVVLQSTAKTITGQLGKDTLPFVLILDPEARLYQVYDIGSRDENSVRSETHSAKVRQAKALGFVHGEYEGNELQLPATFILGPEHTVEFAYYGHEGSDIPAHDVLIDKIKSFS